ncbi:MAG: pilus assembly protein TadG-related protein [Alphaproteobacteria bacterium]|nr:pilus assembly protein TadG-related protein [Alphaproteobacteria bacterium]
MTIPLLAVSFLALTGFAGVAVDVARVQLVQSKLSYSLDAAGLAAGATLSTTDYRSEVTKYLQVNFPAGYLGAAVPTADVTLSSNNMVISTTAVTTVPTTFLNILGIRQVTVSASSQITRTASGLELVMVLDNTYSMAQDSKLTKLKTAATQLVTILTGGQESVRDLWIGLVPFSQAVNIGKAHTSWIDTTYGGTLTWASGLTASTGQAAKDWGGCVDARYANGRDITDDPPATELFKQYYFPSTDQKPWPYTDDNKWVKTRFADGRPKTFYSGIGINLNGLNAGMILGPNSGCPQPVTPMTASATTVTTAVTSMKAVGYTHVGLGLVWGWRMLSPNWRGLWGGEMDTNSLPLNYGAPHMNKAIILLTDGENTMTAANRTAYGYLSESHLGTTDSSDAVDELDDRMTAVCTAIKTQHIYLYTIALGNPGENIQNLMRGCATNENYYFNSPTSGELQAVFSAIGDSLSNLRVSK